MDITSSKTRLIDCFFCSPLQLNSHLEKDCGLTEVSCSYAHVGCQAKVTKQLLLNMILILLSVKQLSNIPHFLWVYRRDNLLGMLEEHKKSL